MNIHGETLSEDSKTIWPIGSKKKLTRKEARECNPPFLPPLDRKFYPSELTAHIGPNGKPMIARDAVKFRRIPAHMVYTLEEMNGLTMSDNMLKQYIKEEELAQSDESSEKIAKEVYKQAKK